MPKFSGKTNVAEKQATNKTKKSPKSVISSAVEQPENVTTYEGGDGFVRDAKSELFMLAVRNMVGETSFYEPAAERDNRYDNLIHKVVVEDADWIARFIPYLRNTMNMRSASIVMAAEAVFALLGKPNKDVSLRKIVDSAITRPDEPAEFLAYWKAKHGAIPKPVKRGLSDAVNRLYNEKNALKYDGQSRGFRMGDVIDLVHPTPVGNEQSALFRWLLDRRHNRENISVEGLPVIEQWNILNAIPQAERREFLNKNGTGVLENAGITWEMLSGWIGGAMTAEVWEAIIPQMGYMALLRNLRNFERAGISQKSKDFIVAKLTNPDEVARSRQFPYRFYSAFKNTESLDWAKAIETALDLSTKNIPELSGKTLVLVDLSGSMTVGLSERSKVANYQVGALFGAALAKKLGPERARLIGFGTGSKEIHIPRGTSVLKLTDTVDNLQRGGTIGWGTETFPAIRKHYKDEDRIVIFTDMQSFPDGKKGVDIPKPIYNFDLGGYRVTNFEMGKNNRYEFGGFTDQAFLMLDLLEKGTNVEWPF